MEKKAWIDTVGRIFAYFDRVHKMPEDTQLELWFEQVSYIPASAIPEILNGLFRDWDSLPRNLPKALKEQYGKAPNISRPIVYDPIEDLRFPVGLMQKAFDILDTQGYPPYRAYCESVHMPQKDRDRVEYKHKVCSAGGNPAEMVRDMVNNIVKENDV